MEKRNIIMKSETSYIIDKNSRIVVEVTYEY